MKRKTVKRKTVERKTVEIGAEDLILIVVLYLKIEFEKENSFCFAVEFEQIKGYLDVHKYPAPGRVPFLLAPSKGSLS